MQYWKYLQFTLIFYRCSARLTVVEKTKSQALVGLLETFNISLRNYQNPRI